MCVLSVSNICLLVMGTVFAVGRPRFEGMPFFLSAPGRTGAIMVYFSALDSTDTSLS